MSKRWGKKAPDLEVRGPFESDLAASMFPVKCSGEGCTKRSSLMLPGDSPYAAAMFLHKGWTVIVGDDPPAMDFFCGECYEKIVKSGEVDEPA